MEVINERHYTLPVYIKHKIKMLERDFFIRLDNSELRHFNELTTEIAVDNYARQLIENHL